MRAPVPSLPSRKIILAAAGMLKALGHSGFDRFLLELGLPDQSVGEGSSLMARSNSLAKYAIDYPDAITADGHPLGAAIVAQADELYRSGTNNNIGDSERDAFNNASSSAGAMIGSNSPNWPLPSQTAVASSSSVQASMLKTWDQAPDPAARSFQNKRVFVVHGHDVEMKQAVELFITKIGLCPIILADQVNGGKTIIEKFEKNADVGYAIVLLSPDDPGKTLARARQNVILEWGYFIGRLGRERVSALKRGDVELPSDIIGIVWETYDKNGGWKSRLANELIEAGFDIDESAALRA